MKKDFAEEGIKIAEELVKDLYIYRERGEKTEDSPLLDDWKDNHLSFYNELKSGKDLPEKIAFYRQVDTENPLREIKKRLHPSHKRLHIIRAVSIAASFILILSIAAFAFLEEKTRKEKQAPLWTQVIPGKEKSSITTSDNQTVLLDATTLVVKGNQLIDGNENGRARLSIKKEQGLQLNKLDVPAGGEHQLTLADGSNIKVNSATELWFPTNFGKETRHTKLQGEAFFQVEANQAHPFVVHLSNDIEVKVTGTTFNVKSYKEEDEIIVALIEGKIEIIKDTETITPLNPGQLFTYHKETETFSIVQSDMSDITDWTSDTFIFRNESIENIMTKLSRWYNVEINIDHEIKDIRYTGILSRKQPLEETLEALRMTNELDFDIKQTNKVNVSEKK